MPLYEYKCKNCNHQFEIKHGVNSRKRKCSVCLKFMLEKLLFAPYIAIKQEPTTVGHLADRNTKKLGKYEKESKMQQYKTAKKPTLGQLTQTEKTEYVETGKLPPGTGKRKLPEKET